MPKMLVVSWMRALQESKCRFGRQDPSPKHPNGTEASCPAIFAEVHFAAILEDGGLVWAMPKGIPIRTIAVMSLKCHVRIGVRGRDGGRRSERTALCISMVFSNLPDAIMPGQ